MGFTSVAERQGARDRSIFYLMFVCPKCSGPIIACLYNPSGYQLHQHSGDVLDVPSVHLEWIEPKPEIPQAPAFTPDAVAAYYVEACDSLKRGKWTSAASMFRKCMEVALREFAPDVEAWKLEKRIDKLATENRITPALKEWAHELRLDGNEALHDIEPATEELAIRMERLTHFLLIYLYTLPQQVAQARAQRENGG